MANFARPLHDVFLKTDSLIDSPETSSWSVEKLKLLFESQKLCCETVYSFSFHELPQFFKDHMAKWMKEFIKYLSSAYPALENTADRLKAVDDLHASVCETINLYMQKYQQEFQDFWNDFASAVWTLLRDVSMSSTRDELATQGSNEELFEKDYMDFIRRDIGGDVDTIRTAACDLLKGVATNYRQQVIEAVSIEIWKLLDSFSADPTAWWKDKAIAIDLFISLATPTAGGLSMSIDLSVVRSFFANYILPELESIEIDSFPLLKAWSLKFVSMFRSHLPLNKVTVDLLMLLSTDSNLVNSYAAICIEQQILENEEAYILKCLMVAIGFAKTSDDKFVEKCLKDLDLLRNDINTEFCVTAEAGEIEKLQLGSGKEGK
ncbi:unnamed protein product [Arabis nemorensis]|uniref:Exportin-2 central domain-containing protein n=1 Tax=Arabis nemorensis TaxID=586526 RepID=A0A565AZB8_9BRAS|nr:unnamed protein product [Arabis nemorensis]